jgi:hypothetical protein
VERISKLGTLAVTVLQLLVTANVVPSSLISFSLMMDVMSSSETSVLTRAKQHHIIRDGILHSHRRENLTFLYVNNISVRAETLSVFGGSLNLTICVHRLCRWLQFKENWSNQFHGKIYFAL